MVSDPNNNSSNGFRSRSTSKGIITIEKSEHIALKILASDYGVRSKSIHEMCLELSLFMFNFCFFIYS
jgi:hypothetical protein